PDVTTIEADKPCSECIATRKVLAKLSEKLPDLTVEVLHRSDPATQDYGIIMTPVVIVDGLVVSMGRRPPAGRLEAILRERLARGTEDA
ncbi:MAG: thioredoxin family protein, partial [Candidatus Brocadiia bacterium]|nr:thioredoxin family protein [Candidatus Brocadiia bacterium]